MKANGRREREPNVGPRGAEGGAKGAPGSSVIVSMRYSEFLFAVGVCMRLEVCLSLL